MPHSHIANSAYPIAKAKLFINGMEILRQNKVKQLHVENTTRGDIKLLSKKSLSRLAFLVMNSPVKFSSLMTLTYGVDYPVNGKQVKENLNRFLVYAKRRYGLFDYLWFLEFQRRGAPHVHICTTLPQPSTIGRAWFAHTWTNISVKEDRFYSTMDRKKRSLAASCFKVHNHRSAWERTKKPDGLARYVVKYALKPQQKIVPDEYRNVGRFWGCSRNVRPREIATVDVSEEEIREYLQRLEQDVARRDILPRRIIIWTKRPK
jgi:hypothetical protein